MMAKSPTIVWGKYKDWQGWTCAGTVPYVLPTSHDFWDECLYVLSKTEGKLDAVSLVDQCICSCGCSQWCDAAPQFSVADMLGQIEEASGCKGLVNRMLTPALQKSNATFKQLQNGKWRFVFDDQRGPVMTKSLQRSLYYGGADGKAWLPEQKAHARVWIECLVRLLGDPIAIAAQVTYAKPRMRWFILTPAQRLIFDDADASAANKDLVRALRLAYISFGGNNPTWACDMLQRACVECELEKWSNGWFERVLGELVFGKGIGIYPIRYDAIVPAIKQLCPGVGMPPDSTFLPRRDYLLMSQGKVRNPRRAQELLAMAGFYTGKVDGVIGEKTKAAIASFQSSAGVAVTSAFDAATLVTLAGWKPIVDAVPVPASNPVRELEGTPPVVDEVTITPQQKPLQAEETAIVKADDAPVSMRPLSVVFDAIVSFIKILIGTFAKTK